MKKCDYVINYSYKRGQFYERDIVICGINRSGSTLIYNIIKNILQWTSFQKMDYFANQKGYYETIKSSQFYKLKKTHNFSYLLKRRIQKKCTIAFFTHRHLLDVVASMIQKGWIKSVKELVINRRLDGIVYNALLMAEIKQVNSIKYSDLLTDRKSLIKQILNSLALELEPTKIDELYDLTEANKILEKIELSPKVLTGDKYVNLETGYHHKHINDPSDGKWRKVLTESDLELLISQKSFRLFCDYFEYQY